MLNRLLKRVAYRLPRIGPLLVERDSLRAGQFVPPGHFYSPIPSQEEVRERADELFNVGLRDLPGINLNVQGQLASLKSVFESHADWDFGAKATPTCRYFYDNNAFDYADGAMLFGMLRAIRPKRVVEVGSGYSSALLLDTNERFLGGSVSCTFIEPYPQLLYKLIRDSDRRTIEVIASGVQKVPLERFTALTSGDILFIDSTHVSKIGSDVNYLFFEVLPALSAGVWIHVHDVLWPFDYPREWITEGRAWNESYLLRAFLQFNPVFRIELFLDFLLRFHPEPFRASMPVALQRPGASLWLRKVL